MNNATLTFEEYQSAKYFPALDGLRAISCLFIMTWHADFLGWGALNGFTGVTSFFVLSGYLITTLALREEAARGSLSLKAFYIRRTFRIFPAYYCVLALYCVLIFGLDIQSSIDRRPALGAAIPYYLFYLNEYSSQPIAEKFGMLPPFFHSWSLGVEEKFYLIWPFLGFTLLHRNPSRRVAIALAFIASFYCFRDNVIVTMIRLNFYVPILVGCILAVLMEQKKYYLILAKLAKPWSHVALLALFLTAQFCQVHRVEDFFYFIFPYAVAMFLVGLVAGKTPITSLLQTRILSHLGLRTYGLYLLHLLSQNAVELFLKPGPAVPLWKSPFYFLACLTVTVIAAEVLHRTVEKPCIAIGRRLSKRVTSRGKALEPSPSEA